MLKLGHRDGAEKIWVQGNTGIWKYTEVRKRGIEEMDLAKSQKKLKKKNKKISVQKVRSSTD